MNVTRYQPSMKHQWDDFVKSSKNGIFMFQRDYMDYHADRFTDHSLMVNNNEGKLFAVFPANCDGNTLYSHQGLTFGGLIYGKSMRTPLMLEAMQALKDYAKANDFAKIIYKAIPYFYHRQPAQEDLYALFRLNARCYRVDVSSTIDTQGEKYGFSSLRKRGLKKARENQLRVEKSEDFESFFTMLNEILAQKYNTKATHMASEMELLNARFPENIHLYACYEANSMVAGIIVYETETVAHTQYISSNMRGKEIGATDLLFDYLINDRYVDKKYFDFGISTEQAGTYLNNGLIDQKEGTGARATIHQFYELTM